MQINPVLKMNYEIKLVTFFIVSDKCMSIRSCSKESDISIVDSLAYDPGHETIQSKKSIEAIIILVCMVVKIYKFENLLPKFINLKNYFFF